MLDCRVKTFRFGYEHVVLALFLVAYLRTFSATQAQPPDKQWDAGCGANQSWACESNWQPNGYPSGSHFVSIGGLSPAAQTLFEPLTGTTATIDKLQVLNGATVDTNGYELVVNDRTSLSFGGTLRILPNASNPTFNSFVTDVLEVTAAGGLVEMRGGVLAANELVTEFDGTVQGWGTIDLAFGGLTHRGVLATGRPSGDINPRYTLEINGVGQYDLCDLKGGDIDIAVSTTLDVNTGPSGIHYCGNMTMGPNSILNISDPWQHTAALTVDAFSSVVPPVAKIQGGEITWGFDVIEGRPFEMTVSSGKLAIEAPLETELDSIIQISESASIQFDAPTNFISTAIVELRDYDEFIVNDTVSINQDSFDWDGVGTVSDNTTIVNANGFLRLNVDNIDVTDNDFDGALTMYSGNVRVNGPGSWRMNGQLTMENVSNDIPVLSGDSVELRGNMNVGGTGPSRIGVPIAAFYSTSTTMLMNDLQLNNPATVVDAGATFGGPGELVNLPDDYLSLGNGSTIGVKVRNRGTMGLDASNASHAEVANFEQETSGELVIDLKGPFLSDVDRLRVTDAADLAGNLTLRLGGYVPAYGDAFTILFADSALNGEFETITGLAISPNKSFAVIQTPTSVIVTTVIPGDANLDGAVDIGDFNIWNSNKFRSGKNWMTGDFNGDGVTDIGDFHIWNSNKFTSVPTVVPEPAAALLWLIPVLAQFARRIHH